MNNPDHKTPFFIKQIDLKFIIGGSILISVLYVILSFILFMNSGARTTISEINAGMNISDPQHSDIDTTRPIKANDIDNYVSNIKDKVKNLDDNNDFGQSFVSDKTLGL